MFKFNTQNSKDYWAEAIRHRPLQGWKKQIRLFLSQRTEFLAKIRITFISVGLIWIFGMDFFWHPHIHIHGAHFKEHLFYHFIISVGLPLFLVLAGLLISILELEAKFWGFEMAIASDYILNLSEKLVSKYPQFLPILQAWACVGPLTEREASVIRKLDKYDERNLLTPGQEDSRMIAFTEFSKRIGIDQTIIETIRFQHGLTEKLPQAQNKQSSTSHKRL